MTAKNMHQVKSLLLICGATLCVVSCGDSKAGTGESDDGRGERDTTLILDAVDTAEPDDTFDVRDVPEVFVDTVEPQPPLADAGGNRGGVPNVSIVFDGSRSSDPDGDVIRYEWAFGNGDTATGVVTNYAYENAGVFTVTLTVTDNDGLTDTDEITIDLQEANDPPQAVIDGPFAVVAGEENEWNALRSTDDIAIRAWTWDFGVEGEPETLGQRAEFTYRQWGVYTMTLTVEDTDAVRDISTQSIDVLAPPTAFFDGPGTGFVGEELEWDGTLSFDDDAEEGAPNGGIVRWTWDWDDGTPPLVGPPFGRHIYTVPGRYDVFVTVEDADGITRSSATKKLDVFEIPNLAPTPVISAERFTIDECQSLAFDASLSVDDTDTASTLRYVWDFGDGSTLSGQSVDHDWRRDGEYTVTLTAIDSDEARGEAQIVVTVNNLQPTASFTLTPPSVLEGDTVLADGSASFDGCDGSISTYAWDWGDGTLTPATSSPVGSHVYDDFGEYDVRLTVVDDGAAPLQDEAERSIEVIFDAPNQPPIPVISAERFIVDECQSLSFDASLSVDDTDAAGSLRYLWDFGDGATISGQSVEHDWRRDGEFTVTLTAIDSEEARGEAQIIVTVNSLQPTAAFTLTPTSVLEGQTVLADASTSFDRCDGSISTYAWDWGDGTLTPATSSPVGSHVYDDFGEYDVRLTVVDDGAAPLQDEAERSIEVTFDAPNQPPIPVISASDFTIDECEEVDFGASLTVDDTDGPLELIYLWDFGDGGSQSGLEVSHDWEREGEYEVTLAVIDSGGARGEASVFVTVENIAPTAIFTALPAPVTLGSSLNVDANASFDGCEGSVVRYRLDWGDGSLGTGTPSPVASHTYDEIGTYPVTLTIVDDGDPALETSVQQNISVVEGGGGPTRYVATPAINHQCGGGAVNVRLASAQIVDAAGVITVEATGEQPGNMSSDRCPAMACTGSGDDEVCVCSSQLTAPGSPGCDEEYEMSIVANDDGSYDYDFSAVFTEVDPSGTCFFLAEGCCLGCTSYSTSGTLVPE
ncbi:MAG: PKD repeat protein [Bradymonadia bacterium]